MKRELSKTDVVMKAGVLEAFEYNPEIGMDKAKMLQRLRESPSLALELLSYTGPIVYMGRRADSLGVRFVEGRKSAEVTGGNEYGEFLSDVRDTYLKELKSKGIVEKPIDTKQIVVDFTQRGASRSDIEEAEEEDNERYVHTDVYRPVKFRFDANRAGTTGHAERKSSSDVRFQTFECPFGTSSRSRVLVDSAAEASFLYEKALRDELDWKALFADLKGRGNIKGLSVRQEEDLMRDLRAQFLWMREQICRDGTLSATPIVASSLLIEDASFGRTIYDPKYAPAPAHILARYIQNPFLLFSSSGNSVVRALETYDKDERYVFSRVGGEGEVTIVIDGSDTIGGRVPGTRSVSKKEDVYQLDEKGRYVYNRYREKVVAGKKTVREVQFKTPEQVTEDYVNFASRINEVISNIDPKIRIRFVGGTNVGTAQMLKRYVQERYGVVSLWDYEKKEAEVVSKPEEINEASRFSLVMMKNLSDIYPVLVGRRDSVDFLLDPDDDDSKVTFSKDDGIQANGFVTFSVSADVNNRFVLERGTLAEAGGFPFLHVIENYDIYQQSEVLATESDLSRSAVIGETTFEDSLFEGDVREEWDMKNSFISGSILNILGNDIAYPSVTNLYDSAVYVNGIPFHSVFGAYNALLMKNVGLDQTVNLQKLSSSEQDLTTFDVVGKILNGVSVEPSVKERCMRNAVHMMAQASSHFSESLLSSGEADIVVPSSYGDRSLFVDLKGNGENRFGIVLKAERSSILKDIAYARVKAEAEGNKIAEENARMRRQAGSLKAEGQKMAGGLPDSPEKASDAVWFLGTNAPSHLVLPDGETSFDLWEVGYNGEDILNREKASRQFISTVDGGLIPNEYVFLYPTDLAAAMGYRTVKNDPDIRDLTGVRRIDPLTDKEFICAFGIPVKKNSMSFEFDNKYGMPCSFLLDNDNSSLMNSIVNADALARLTAIQHGMKLSYAAYTGRDGKERDDISKVFSEKVWDYPRSKEVFDRKTGKTVPGGEILPTEITRRKYNRKTRSYEEEAAEVFKKTWVDNPHAAPSNFNLVKRYEAILNSGKNFPLNMIRMPLEDYSEVSEAKFIMDFNLALNIANAIAVVRGVPLRFPLDENLKLDLGPDIPEKFRDFAEKRVDSFIGVIKEEDIIRGELPYLQRISMYKALINGQKPLEMDGSNLYIRPNDLLVAFGQYDFSQVENGANVPIHEMAFQMEDGTVFRLTDPRLTHRMKIGEINKYLRYEKNDECRFTVRSSDPKKIPQFIIAVKSYIERAQRIKVDYRIVSTQEMGVDTPDGESLEGFVNLLSSNSDIAVNDTHDLAARPNETALDSPNRFDGTDNGSSYYGKEDANDAFQGYAQYRYTLPDGTESDWKTVKDLELAKDIVLMSTHRVYSSDTRITPTGTVLTATLKSLAVKDAGSRFLGLHMPDTKIVVDDKIIHSERKVPVTQEVKPPVASQPKKMNIYAGSNENPEFSNFALRPFIYDVKKFQVKM